MQISPGGTLSNEDQWTSTYYIHDAQGNPMAIYRRFYEPDGVNYTDRLQLDGLPIYGSARLGKHSRATEHQVAFSTTGFSSLKMFEDRSYSPITMPVVDNSIAARTLGTKTYELSNHLGNVLNTISDRRLAVPDGTDPDLVDHYLPQVTSTSDYYPFGSLLPGRNYSSGSYRFGFNGQEKDDEVFGATGTSYTAEFWQYDARVGRRWNLDPVVAPWESGYAAFRNNPIFLNDPRGDCPDCGGGGDEKPGFESGAGTTENPIQGPEAEIFGNRSGPSKAIYDRSKDIAGLIPGKGQSSVGRAMDAARLHSPGKIPVGNFNGAYTGSEYMRPFGQLLLLGFAPAVIGVAGPALVGEGVSYSGALFMSSARVAATRLFQASLTERAASGSLNAGLQLSTSPPGDFDAASFGSSVATGNPFFGPALSSAVSISPNKGVQFRTTGDALRITTTGFIFGSLMKETQWVLGHPVIPTNLGASSSTLINGGGQFLLIRADQNPDFYGSPE